MMLKGISPVISPDLLKVLAKMGHGDEISIVDGNYPAESVGIKVIRADGVGVPAILEAIVALLPIDNFVDENIFYMDNSEKEKPPIWQKFDQILKDSGEDCRIKHLERFDYYDRTKKSVAVIATSETAIYANVILKKGVIFPK